MPDWIYQLLQPIWKIGWFWTRPKVIRKLIREFPPMGDYIIKSTGQRVTLLAYAENGTMRVQAETNEGIPIQVFGIPPEDLTHA